MPLREGNMFSINKHKDITFSINKQKKRQCFMNLCGNDLWWDMLKDIKNFFTLHNYYILQCMQFSWQWNEPRERNNVYLKLFCLNAGQFKNMTDLSVLWPFWWHFAVFILLYFANSIWLNVVWTCWSWQSEFW